MLSADRTSKRLFLAFAWCSLAGADVCTLTIPIDPDASSVDVGGNIMGMGLHVDFPQAPHGPSASGEVRLQLVDRDQCPHWGRIRDIYSFWKRERVAISMNLTMVPRAIVVKAAAIKIDVTDVAAALRSDGALNTTKDGELEGSGVVRITSGQAAALGNSLQLESPDEPLHLRAEIMPCSDAPNLELVITGTGTFTSESLPGKKSHIDLIAKIVAQQAEVPSSSSVIKSIQPAGGRWNESTRVTLRGLRLIDHGVPLRVQARDEQDNVHECSDVQALPAPASISKAFHPPAAGGDGAGTAVAAVAWPEVGVVAPAAPAAPAERHLGRHSRHERHHGRRALTVSEALAEAIVLGAAGLGGGHGGEAASAAPPDASAIPAVSPSRRALRGHAPAPEPQDAIACTLWPGDPGQRLVVELADEMSCGAPRVLFTYSGSSCPAERQSACLDIPNAQYDLRTCECACAAGFGGAACGLCDPASPAACGATAACSAGDFEFHSREPMRRSYECMPADVPKAFAELQITVECSAEPREKGSCEIIIGAPTTSSPFSSGAVHCDALGCDFANGASAAHCERVECDLGPYKEALKSMLGRDTIGGSASFTCAAPHDSLSRCVVSVSDLPIPLSADCRVSECVDQAVLVQRRRTREWRLASSVALAVLALLVVVGTPTALWLVLRKPRVRASSSAGGTMLPTTAGAGAGAGAGAAGAGPPAGGIGPRAGSSMAHSVSELTFDELSVVAASGRQILSSVSGLARAGECLGVMGASGSGKTTFLDVLAGIVPGGARCSGRVAVDDEPLLLGASYPPSLISYCQQHDLLPSTMSVRECVTFASLLTLPVDMPKAEKLERADEAIAELSLTHVADSIVGDAATMSAQARVSGGERRRISLAMSLVVSPAVLLCDEVTSGLDSTTAYQLIQSIRRLAKRGRVVVLSIHQPSSRAFMGLDRLMLMRSGVLTLAAPTSELVSICAKARVPCSPGINMADHLLDVLAVPEEAARLSAHSAWAAAGGVAAEGSDGGKAVGHAAPEVGAGGPLSPSAPRGAGARGSRAARPSAGARARRLWIELWALYWRSALSIVRHPSLLRLHLLVAVVAALVVGGLFHGLANDVAGLQNRIGAVFFVLALFGFSGLSAMEVFMSEKALNLRELRNGYYSLPAVLLTKLTMDMLLLRVVPAFAFTACFYPLVNFDPDVWHFVAFLAVAVLVNVAAGTLVAALSIPFDSLGSANLCATILMLVLLLLNGALLNLSDAPDLVGMVQSLSFFRFGFQAMLGNELHDKVVMIQAPGVDPFPLSANLFLSLLGIDPTRLRADMIALVLFGLAHCLLAGLLLKWKAMPSRAAITFEQWCMPGRLAQRIAGSQHGATATNSSKTFVPLEA